MNKIIKSIAIFMCVASLAVSTIALASGYYEASLYLIGSSVFAFIAAVLTPKEISNQENHNG